MKKCPRCKLPLSKNQENECQHCGFVFEKTRPRISRILTLILVPATAILLIAYLVAPQKLANRFHNQHRIKDRFQVLDNQDLSLKTKSKDIYQVFLDHYSARPDTRFIKAFEIAIDLYEKYHEIPKERNAFRIGDIKLDKSMVVVPILKNEEVVRNIQLPVSMTFAEVMHALDQCLETIEEEKRLPPATPQRGIYWLDQYKTALRSFHMVDPRSTIEGLLELENLRQEHGPDSRLILAAARGYALLHISLYPDYMQYADDFASYALGYLALAKHIDPRLPSDLEEAFIAMDMGYTSHAEHLLENSRLESTEPTSKVLDAYMRKDFSALTELQGEGSRVLGYYFLARLYRESGLYREAENVANGLVKRFTNHYPTIVEMIYSADLSIAKLLTILYPLDILARMEQKISPESLEDGETWMKRVKIFAGDLPAGSKTSFSDFESLLLKWKPLDIDKEYRFFIDENRIKNIYRALYSGAVYLRYNVLLNRWNVDDKAENYVKALSDGAGKNPLLMAMSAEVMSELGRQSQAKSICEQIIRHSDTSALIAMKAYFCVDNIQTRLKFAPGVAEKLDGRPYNLTNMGHVFNWLHNYDMAEKFYILALKHAPFNFSNYQFLAKVTGSDEPITNALKTFSYNFLFLEEAGNYFAQKTDTTLKLTALDCYDKALKLAPSAEYLWRKKADVLKDLKRYRESAQVLQDWIDTHGRKDLTTTIFKGKLANRYLDMAKPQKALDVLADEIGSYQGGVMMTIARAYEALERLEEAEEIYKKAVKRYPTANHILSGIAAFMWRSDRNDEAAEYIAKGRKLNDRFSRWYFDDYMKVFARAPEERIIKAFDYILAKGAGVWEINALAFRFNQGKRPEIAYKILTKAPAGGHMQQLENCINKYKVVRKWKGEDEARKLLAPYVSPQLHGPLSIILFKEGLFDLILTEIKDPDHYPQKHREFMWLLKLMAWQACKKPDQYLSEFTSHYNKSSSDYYHFIGKYMMGKISRSELLQLIKTPKQRCEFAYYIGFSERMNGNFHDAANWYQICLETGLSNNGEYHWAADELFWWAHMGTKNRHKNVSDDISAREYPGRQ
jgi:tetratricopeptide (TPR) repeat protein